MGSIWWYEPIKQVVCVLHCVLNNTAVLFADTIVPLLWDNNTQKDARKTRAGEGEEILTKIEMLRSQGIKAGINFPHATPTSKVEKQSCKGIVEHRFVGNECLSLVDIIVALLFMLLPVGVSREIDRHREVLLKLWAAHTDVVAGLYTNKAMTADGEGGYLSNDEIADDVQACAIKFVELYTELKPDRTNLYLHLLVKHIPDQIRIFGPLLPFSGMALEAGHIDIKRCMRWNTNFLKAGAGRSKRKDGTFTVHGCGRIAQIMKNEAVFRAIAAQMPLPGDADVMMKLKHKLAKEEKREAERAKDTTGASSVSPNTSPVKKKIQKVKI